MTLGHRRSSAPLAARAIEHVIPLMERAVHLSPRDPQIGNWDRRIGLVYLVQSRIDDAIFWLEKARVAAPELYWVMSGF
jgi:hypothetical protein